ncbi:MAG TPA: alpha/beta hydrolase [Chloroflexota bacterium]|nr:alpha/beta hydrolase [Chloroflexota bacterium]
MEATADRTDMLPVAGGELEIYRGGSGPRVVLLHGCYGWWGWEDVHERLAGEFTVLAPVHPGFGRSSRLPGVDSVDDLAYFYLDLFADWNVLPVRLVGFGLGGWIAAEVAVRCPQAVERLVLVDSVGIKISDRETRDIADPFILIGDEQQPMFWHDPSTHRVPIPTPTMPEQVLQRTLRNAEAAMYYGWKPYMHNPKLRQRLHRIAAPTLVVWGEEDRIVSRSYGQAFAESIPDARFVAIPDSGHYPYREQLDRFAAPVVEFLR